MVGPVDIGAEIGAEYLAVAFGAEFLPGTKHVPGELVYPLAAFSPGNLHHSQLLQVRVEVVLLVYQSEEARVRMSPAQLQRGMGPQVMRVEALERM